jgi:hypothetical protein
VRRNDPRIQSLIEQLQQEDNHIFFERFQNLLLDNFFVDRVLKNRVAIPNFKELVVAV